MKRSKSIIWPTVKIDRSLSDMFYRNVSEAILLVVSGDYDSMLGIFCRDVIL
jgi:hypothetical protein